MAGWTIPPADHSGVYVDLLRDLEPEAVRLVRNQHVTSKVVLKRFAEPDQSGKGWLLTLFDLRYGKKRPGRGLDGCGKIPDFLIYASASAERIWKSVEDKMHDAIEAARDGRLHQDGLAEVIRDAVALHVVRSPYYLPMHRAAVAWAAEHIKQQTILRRPELLRAEFRRRHYGLEPGGPEALASVLDEPIAKWLDLDRRGALVRAGIEGMFRRVREAVRSQPVEVCHVPAGRQLLISDSPAVPCRLSAGTVIPRVAVAEADVIIMPLAMDCMVLVGPLATDGDSQMTPDQVSLINTLQVSTAYGHVYYHPGSNLGAFVERTAASIPAA